MVSCALELGQEEGLCIAEALLAQRPLVDETFGLIAVDPESIQIKKTESIISKRVHISLSPFLLDSFAVICQELEHCIEEALVVQQHWATDETSGLVLVDPGTVQRGKNESNVRRSDTRGDCKLLT